MESFAAFSLLLLVGHLLIVLRIEAADAGGAPEGYPAGLRGTGTAVIPPCKHLYRIVKFFYIDEIEFIVAIIDS